ncbi:MAG TPA: ester cyclase [Thermoanaerobaculia bacterium]
MRGAVFLVLGLLALPVLSQETPSPAPPSPVESNKALVRRYLEVLSGGDLATLGEVVSPDFSDRTPGAPAVKGPASIQETQRRARELFRDIRYTLDDLIAEGDHVVARYTVRAHRSGKPVEVMGMTLFRIEGGKIREAWVVNDQIELFRQLGYTLLPPAQP